MRLRASYEFRKVIFQYRGFLIFRLQTLQSDLLEQRRLFRKVKCSIFLPVLIFCGPVRYALQLRRQDYCKPGLGLSIRLYYFCTFLNYLLRPLNFRLLQDNFCMFHNLHVFSVLLQYILQNHQKFFLLN